MRYLLGIVLAGLLIGALLYLLYDIVRFGIVSSARTKGWKGRLRIPQPEGIDRVAGFSPSNELIEFYKQSPLVEAVEYYLVDPSKQPIVYWPIGAFVPLTALDIKEKKKISGVPGIPLADDLDKGMYFVTSGGTVMLQSPDVPGGEVVVAPDIEVFARFERRDAPPEE